MCSYFQEQSKDSVRQIIFSSLFSPQGNKADDSRMSLLGKLVSMAVAVCRIPVLECAASWLQVLLSKDFTSQSLRRQDYKSLDVTGCLWKSFTHS